MEWQEEPPEQQHIVLVAGSTLREAEKLIESCEHCNADGAEIPFDCILHRVIGLDSTVTNTDYIFDLTDYILESPAKCPNCRRKIFEKTLIDPIDDS